MPTRLRLLSLTLLLLALPLFAQAADDAAPASGEVQASSETPNPAVPADESEPEAPANDHEFIAQPNFAPQPVPACTYRCPSGESWDCPDIPDTPPATCKNGCCNYDTPCEGSCQFNSDCGELASCWSGCYYSWVH